MNRIKIFSFALIVITVCGCQSDGKENLRVIDENDFKNASALKSESKPTKEILAIHDFFIRDSLLVVLNQSREDSLIMVFDIGNFKCVRSWGVRGKGPKEYGLFMHLINLPGNIFKVADFSRQNMQTYSFPELELLHEEAIIHENVEKNQFDIPQKIVSADGEVFFYDNYVNRKLTLSKWRIGNLPERIQQFKQFEDKYKNKSSMAYSGHPAMNGRLKRLVYAYQYLRRFDILDFDGNIIRSVEITPNSDIDQKFRDNGEVDGGKTVLCYLGAVSTDQSFYLHYLGHSPDKVGKDGVVANSFIEQYDWDGNPIKRYKLNEFIYNFEILSENNDSKSFIANSLYNNDPLLVLKETK